MSAGSEETFVFLEITYTLSERWQLVNVKGPWIGGTRAGRTKLYTRGVRKLRDDAGNVTGDRDESGAEMLERIERDVAKLEVRLLCPPACVCPGA